MGEETSTRTLQHYETHALEFRRGTLEHDVSQNVNALLGAIEGAAPYRILDFGCGPGRDLVTFKSLGHNPVGLDGCERFVEMARADAGVEVWHQDFLSLALPFEAFDGVFANASLFHIPSAALPRVLRALWSTLRPGGAFVCSNPRGDAEGWHGERYGCYLQLDGWCRLFEDAGFQLLHHFYRPMGLPRPEQPWLVLVLRRGTVGAIGARGAL
jgi:SAM-dependent methyltransferase